MATAPAPAETFQGYDSVSGRGLSTALSGTISNRGGESTVNCTVCTSLTQLKEALEINQSLSVSYGPIGSIDQKMSFLRTLDVTTNSVSIVVYAKHSYGIDLVTDASVREEVKVPHTPADVIDFFSVYGDFLRL